MKRAELHTHSLYSDGTSAPRDVVARAASAKVDLLFLTDHDSVSGIPEALEAADELGVDLRCGIEINTSLHNNVHVLGYGIRWKDAVLLERLEDFRGRRTLRIRRIVEQLRRHGIDIAFEDIQAVSHEALGRPHVADALRRKGVVGTRQEAFNRFLTRGKPGYVESMGPTPEEAIDVIRAAGGFSVLAHPETVGDLDALEGWQRRGLEGLEVYYGAHSPSEVVRYRELADRHGLIPTGGTDFHGPGTGRDKPLGVQLPDDVFGRFMERLARCG